MKHTVSGHVKDGVFTPDIRYQYREMVSAFDGGRVWLTMERYSRKRSTQQNRYYWGVVIEIIHRQLVDDGWEVSVLEVHELMKSMHNKRAIVNYESGEAYEIAGSTTELSTVDMEAYIERVRLWANDQLQTQIPEPNE